MVIVSSSSIALGMCIVAMGCWGSWANTQKLAGEAKWPFQLYYWDVVIGVLLFSLIMAFTMGSMGTSGRSFLADLSQASGNSLTLAFLGGVVFNLANLLIVIAIQIAGMAVAFPVGIGLALVLGVFINYIMAPSGNPFLIFAGVAGVALAIILSSVAYSKLNTNTDNSASTRKGLIIAIIGGALMSTFFYLVQASMSLNFSNLASGKLGPYSAVVIFSVGVLISNFIFNSVNMYKPITGEVCSYKQYRNGTSKLHFIGILGGCIWCMGMSCSINASGAASPAIAYGLAQGATMVAAIWGVFIWREFKSAPSGTNKILAIMFLSFMAGLGLIIAAM
jgi:glucose uptake protein